MTCKARQQSDQMFCASCNLIWDMNDPEPPECALEQRNDEVLNHLIAASKLCHGESNTNGVHSMIEAAINARLRN